MTLRSKMDDFVKALSHALISSTDEARAFSCAVAVDELRTLFQLYVHEAQGKAQTVLVTRDSNRSDD